MLKQEATASPTMMKEVKDEMRRLNNKNAALERNNTELRMRVANMKRQITTLQSKVNKYDKKVDKVAERVVKEIRTLQSSDENDIVDGILPRDPVKKTKLDITPPKNVEGASIFYGDTSAADIKDKGLDSIIASISKSNEKKTPANDKKGVRADLLEEGGHRPSTSDSRQRLLSMMSKFLSSDSEELTNE